MSLNLQNEAEALGQSLPPLLAEAEMLAATVMLGEHGRRRAGSGDEFWQYRAAHPGDPAKSMAFAGGRDRPAKGERARLVALALAVLLLRGGERVGLAGLTQPRSGRSQILRLAARLAAEAEAGDYGAPETAGMVGHGRAVFLSDFLGPIDAVEAALARAADRGVKGALLQVLDPAEEEFPFDGRVIFESMSGAMRHETQQAGELRNRYLARLAERKDRLAGLARAVGWQFSTHHTGAPAQSALLWLYRALEGGR